MQIGIIGVGVIGNALKVWLQQNTTHTIKCLDPMKGMNDDLTGSQAIFVSVPVPATETGQDLSILKLCVNIAKNHVAPNRIFIRSTVLPGTNDQLGTVAMPEFLTERFAIEDFTKHPILIGKTDKQLISEIFPKKDFIMVENMEAELAKFTHNCFGAIKVTYFNAIKELCEANDLNFNAVKTGAMITGYIEREHTQVPGPDGKYGYGGKCFPENMLAMTAWLNKEGFDHETQFFSQIINLNNRYRPKGQPQLEVFI